MVNWFSNLFKGPDIAGYLERKAVVIDVRTSQEFKRGHAQGSKNIPLQQIGAKMASIKKLNKPVIVCCRSGNRSGIAARAMRQQGIDVINGGAWQRVAREMKSGSK